MALNAEVSFTWLGRGTWRIRSANWKDILIDPWVISNPRPSALQELVGSGVEVVDIKPGDVV